MQILINESLKGIFVIGIDISVALHILDRILLHEIAKDQGSGSVKVMIRSQRFLTQG